MRKEGNYVQEIYFCSLCSVYVIVFLYGRTGIIHGGRTLGNNIINTGAGHAHEHAVCYLHPVHDQR